MKLQAMIAHTHAHACLAQQRQPSRDLSLSPDDVGEIGDHEYVLETRVPEIVDVFTLCCTCTDGDTCNRVEQMPSHDFVSLNFTADHITDISQDSTELRLNLDQRLSECSEVGHYLS